MTNQKQDNYMAFESFSRASEIFNEHASSLQMEDSREFVRIEMIQVLPTPTPCNPLSTSLSLIIPLFEMGEATFNVISSNFIFLL